MRRTVSRRSFLRMLGTAGVGTAALATTAGTGAVTALAEDVAAAADETCRFVSDYGTDIYDEAALTQLEQDCSEWGIREVEEGCVLLLNDNDALPLPEGSGVTLLGQNSIETTLEVESAGGFGAPQQLSGPFYSYHSGGDAAAGAMVPTQTYLECMQAAYEVNPTMVEAYQTSGYMRLKDSEAPEIGEAPIDLYTDELKASWADAYNDAAVIMITRQASEDCDLMLEDPTGISALALHPEERDLLAMVQEEKDAGRFQRVIVLVNSSWAVELGELADYGVDAALWVGAPGATGFNGVVHVLTGEVCPSGKLVDTYAKNSLSAPAITYAQLKNTPTWANLDEVLDGCADTDRFVSYYLIYAEGIYVGYKYYETRYEDCVLGRGNADGTAGSSTGSSWNYNDEVAYPFGYGLSYTTFDQALDGVTYDESTDVYTVSVTVTNTGSVAGKSVVEVYAQTPYGDYERQNNVEKSAVQIVGFGKTAELEPGSSETLEIEVERYLLASYDYTSAKGYIISEGTHYLAIGDDAHDALNNILAAKGATGMTDVLGNAASGNAEKVYSWDEASLDTASYARSRYTDVTVTNQFDDADINTLGCETVTYLTRSDWEGTFPTEQVAITATEEMIRDLDGYTYETPADAPAVSDFTQGEDSGLSFADMYGLDYDDDAWETFLNQLTVEEMASIMPDNNGSVALDSIAMPASYRGDDMDCLEQVHFKLNDQSGFLWPSIMLSASTWNREEIAQRATYTANEAYFMGCTEIWSGGPNIHRTPFNGRATAYYSEDGQMGYFVGQVQAEACQKYGVILGLKHLCVNDQEARRESAATFTNEQAMRENYLRAFEGAYAKGGAAGLMTAFNRIGTTYCGSSYELLTTVLRDEWGAHVTVCSDAVVGSDYKKHYAENLAAGMDYWCWDTAGFGASQDAATSLSSDVIPQLIEEGDGYMLQCLRQATKNHVYAEVNSILVNGLSADAQIVHTTPWWQTALTGATVGSGVLTAGFLGLYAAKAFAWDGKAEKGGE